MIRTAALLMLGGLVVHELRYALAFGDQADVVLAHHGHGYLTMALPLLAMLTAVVLAGGLVAAASRPALRTPRRVAVLWPLAAVGLLGLYSSQELIEGLAAPGHPAGWAAVFGAGGWIAIPLSLVFGGLVAAAVRIVDLAEDRVRGLLPSLPSITVATDCPGRLLGEEDVASARRARLADHLAGRAPPVGCAS